MNANVSNKTTANQMVSRSSSLASFCAFLYVLLTACLFANADDRMNVLFIAVDDLRPELSCYGSSHIQSPNIDRFASSGLLFSRAYCQQSVCNPSRTSLMTGLRPNTTGVTGNHSHFRTTHPNVVTLPQHFKNHGYFTKAIGKLYHGVFPDGSSNTKWDTMGDPESWSVPATRFGPRYYYTEPGIASAKTAFLNTYNPKEPGPDDWTKKLVFGLATESPDVPDDTLYDGMVADSAIRALRELKQKPDQPFFLAVGFIKPHSPYIAPKSYFDLYDRIDIAEVRELPDGSPGFAAHGSGELRRYSDQPKQGLFSTENQIRVRHAYYACVSYIDAQIGRVLDELDRLGLAENTIVTLYGDHGYHLGEQGLWGKTTNFELDTRVPLIVRVPGMETKGKSTNSIVELLDLYPTLAELAGLPVDEQLEGKSFVQILDDPAWTTKEFALSQYPRRGGLMGYSLRNSSHRLTLWVETKTGSIEGTELYEYVKGQFIESRNLANDESQQARVDDLSEQLVKEFGLDSITLNSNSLTNDSSETRQLNATGTSFEESSSGIFDSENTSVGIWKVTSGTASIDKNHSRTGKQCLHLLGSESTALELELAKNVETDGQLTFSAERWTRRDPFEFRISKRSKGNWIQIYNGDNQIRVGRAFLSDVVVPLNDPDITHFRFSVTSPNNTGILIDDLKFEAATKQRISRAEVIPTTIPALVGNKACALLKLKISVEGTLNPISLTELTSTLKGTTEIQDLETVQVYYGESNPNFTSARQFGNILPPKKESLVHKGSQALVNGENYFWIACTLANDANIDHNVGAAVSKISFSNDTTIRLNQTPSIQRMGVAIRNGGDDGVHTYRIPGLVTTNQGTLIGVYDVRHRESGDLPGDIDVGMSRSTDGGRNWEPMKVIMDMGDDPEFNYDGIGDPSVMVDRLTGTIWVAATWSHGNRSWRGSQPGLEPIDTGQFMLARSDDDGVTWSAPINITKQIKKPEWSFLLQGPGKGITMSDGTLVFPVQYQDPPSKSDKNLHRLPHSSLIYSRDHGKTWKMATGAWDDTTESQIVELTDGKLMINCRTNRSPHRAILTTSDMGKTWNRHATHLHDLIEPGACMASLINVERELEWRSLSSGFDKRILLFSNPNSLKGRKHITIKASLDSGMSWPESQQLLLDEPAGRGYSCMSMIDEKTVGILYEGSQAQMTFQRIKLADVLTLNHPKHSQSGPQANRCQLVPSQRRRFGNLSVARVFGDHMVLQADQPARIWGTSDPGSNVFVSFGSTTVSTMASKSGLWKVLLPKLKQNSNPQSLMVKSNDETIELGDILVGEVWFCAGQSNMEWPLKKTNEAKRAIAHSADGQLRLLNFVGAARGGSGVYGEEQFNRLRAHEFSQGTWKISNQDSAGEFSAVGYYFAEHLRKNLNCPIGMINVSIGGTPVEAWIEKTSLNTHPELSAMVAGNWLDNPLLDQWCQQRARENLKRGLAGDLFMPGDQHGPNHSFKPGFMFDAGVKPFLPMSLKGVLWYQGESNAESRQRVVQYKQAFPLLVKNWRSGFENPEMPIAFVQLPAMGRPNWPVFREYQRRSLDELKNVGMAITIDTGNPTNVHPPDKAPVAQRLAHWALVSCYDHSGPSMGPLLHSSSIEGQTLVLTFSQVGSELKTGDGAFPNHFEVAGSDGVFHPAIAHLVDNDKVVVRSPKVTQPVDARYAWAPFPVPTANLVNSADIPASPFTTQKKF